VLHTLLILNILLCVAVSGIRGRTWEPSLVTPTLHMLIVVVCGAPLWPQHLNIQYSCVVASVDPRLPAIYMADAEAAALCYCSILY
jgi:NhaP-type Na+/H+ or K+/H+ antiporter